MSFGICRPDKGFPIFGVRSDDFMNGSGEFQDAGEAVAEQNARSWGQGVSFPRCPTGEHDRCEMEFYQENL
jgi:hypothetical protein